MAQVPKKYYFDKKYLTLERFISYFYQLQSVSSYDHKRILFIGVGDGAVPFLLKKDPGCEVITLDFDAALQPDKIGDIRKLDFPDSSFDLVCAFEVLEHIPYEEVLNEALPEMARIAKQNIVISVPHRRIGFEMTIKFPFIRSLLKKDFINIGLRFPVRFPGFAVSGQHYWEIDNSRTTNLNKFRTDLQKNFNILKETTPVLDFYRRFFYLQVR